MGASFPLALSFFLLCGAAVAQIEQRHPWRQGTQRLRGPSECRLERLNAHEPSRRVESEAGVSEYWDQNNEQFDCAGVAAVRHTIQQRGLLLPSFTNAPRLMYIEQGRGFTGVILPGCPETYQSVQPQQLQQERGPRVLDQHQKIRRFRAGDIIALPAGVAHYCYNDGDTPVVMVQVLDTSNAANQLDRNLRIFSLAGNERDPPQGAQQETRRHQERPTKNILSGFDAERLAQAFGVSTETARKLQSQDDRRGRIVRVESGLQVVQPSGREEEEEERRERGRDNGLEETICSMRLKENIADSERADVYSPQAGRIRSLNSQKLRILNHIQLSAERGVLYRNALMAPHWNINAHSVVYCTRGNGRIQVAGDYGRLVYDGELRQGQILIVPQNFAVLKQAGNQGFEWVAFKTSDNAMINQIAGKASTIRGIPEAVLMNSYGISREEARRLKENRAQELMLLSPGSQSKQRERGSEGRYNAKNALLSFFFF